MGVSNKSASSEFHDLLMDLESIEIPTHEIGVLQSPHGVLSAGEADSIARNPVEITPRSKALSAAKSMLAAYVQTETTSPAQFASA